MINFKRMMSVKINPLGLAVVAICIVATLFYIFGTSRGWVRFSDEKVSMKELLSVSICLAERGGKKVKEVFDEGVLNEQSKGKTKEGLNDPKTDGDMKSHRAIVYGFQKVYPGLTVMSEEHENPLKPFNAKAVLNVDLHLTEVSDVIKSDETVPLNAISVWIDPLDATYEYSERKDKDGKDLKHFVTTMVCVVLDGKPIIGVVHKPFKDETVWAWVGYGVSKNSLPIHGSSSKDTIKAIVSRSHTGKGEQVLQSAFEGKKLDIIHAGGAGYKSLEVLQGRADLYAHVTDIKKWDICAGHAILAASDGKMTTIKNNDINFSPDSGAVVKGGILASMNKHSYYSDKLSESLKVTEGNS